MIPKGRIGSSGLHFSLLILERIFFFLFFFFFLILGVWLGFLFNKKFDKSATYISLNLNLI